ncbi:GL16925 [Drosophila persimilis]|uniref:GL16925 n=1 Tax=Drosophila persimilis TaxID=7234 RepID=B4GHK5_DROPE|nr:GL16925 [Drosophila persimilis]
MDGHGAGYIRKSHHYSKSYGGTRSPIVLAKPSNGRSSSSYRPTTTGSGSHSSAQYETGSRSRESVRYRSAPYPKIR